MIKLFVINPNLGLKTHRTGKHKLQGQPERITNVRPVVLEYYRMHQAFVPCIASAKNTVPENHVSQGEQS